MSGVQDIIDQIVSDKLSSPTTTQPRLIPTPTLPSTPSIPRLNLPPANLSFLTKLQDKPKDRGFWGGLVQNVLRVPGIAYDAVKGVPTFAGKTVQTLAGIGETVFDAGTNIFDKNLYNSRLEVDFKKGEALGLSGADLIGYSMQRQLPLGAVVIPSFARTGARIGEVATLGLWDTGEAGFDYYQGLKQGTLTDMLVEDVGNAALLGTLGAAAGVTLPISTATSTALASSRLGRAGLAVRDFSIMPVGSTIKGTARLTGSLGEKLATSIPQTSRFARPLTEAANRVATSPYPLRSLAGESSIQLWRARANSKAYATQNEINLRKDQQRNLSVTSPAWQALEFEIKDLEKLRIKYNKRAGLFRDARTELTKLTREAEQVRTTLVAAGARYASLGMIPDTVEHLQKQADFYRQQAEVKTSEGDTPTAANLNAVADFYQQQAEVKATDTTGTFENPAPTWVAPATTLLVTQKLNGILLDLQQGLSIEEILKNLQPEQLTPDLSEMGYGYTIDDVQKAIAYAQNTLSPIERIQIDIYKQYLQNWHQFWWDQTQQRVGMTTETIPFTYAGTAPDPGLLLRYLEDSQPRYKELMYQILDEYVLEHAEEIQPGLLAEAKIDVKSKGTWKKLAAEPIDSAEYVLAYEVLKLAFNELRANPTFAELMQAPMIYPAPMRPAMFVEQRRLKQAMARDTATMAQKLQQLLDEHGDLLDEKTKTLIEEALIKAAGREGRFDKKTFNNLLQKLSSISNKAADQLARLETDQGLLATRQSGVDTKLSNAITVMNDVQLLIETITDNPAAVLGDTPRLTSAKQALEENFNRRDSIPAELAVIDEAIAASVAQQKADNVSIQQDADNLKIDIADGQQRLNDTLSEQERLQTEHDDLQSDIDAYNKLTEEQLAFLPQDLSIALGIAGESSKRTSVTEGQARATKRLMLEEAQQYADVTQGVMERLLPSPLRRHKTKLGSLEADYNLNSFMQEDYRSQFEAGVQSVSGIEDPKKVVRDFINAETVIDDGQPIDNASKIAEQTDAFGNQTKEFESTSDFMFELGRAWAEQQLAEQTVRRIKQTSLKSMREQLLKQDGGDELANAIYEATEQRADSVQQIERMFEFLDRDTLSSAVTRRGILRKKLDDIEGAITRIERPLAERKARLTDLTERLRPKISPELQKQRATLELELRDGKKLMPKLVREVNNATKNQAKTETTRVRQRLTGVAKLDADGRPVVLTSVADKLTDQQEQALNETVNINTKVAEIRQRQQEQQGVQQSAGEGLAGSRTEQQVQLSRPVGPQLITEPPVYLPGGPTASVQERVAIPMTMRSEGVAPQVKASYENLRTTDLAATSMGQQAERLNEVLGQFARNKVVEEFIKNARFVTPVAQVLGLEKLKEITKEATEALRRQPIDRNSSEFAITLRNEIGTRIIRELDRLGYEPVSPVKFDTTTLEHQPVGGLQGIVGPGDIDANTITMKIGMRDSIASSFRPIEDNSMPSYIRAPLEKVGKLTSAWKSVILPFSARWQVGDLVGNVLNAWLRADISPAELVAAMNDVKNRLTVGEDGLVRTLKSSVADEAIADPVIAALLGAQLDSRGLRGAELSTIREGTLQPARPREFNRYFPRFRKAAFNVNATQNLIARAGVAIIKLEKTLTEQGRSIDEINPAALLNDPVLYDAVVKAVQETNVALGAFSEMTPWERNTLRQVFPFWSWMRYINRAAAELVLNQPDRVLLSAHLGAMVSNGEGDEWLDWLQEKTPGPFGYLFDLRFLNPYGDAAIFQKNPLKFVGQEFTSISPVIQKSVDAANILSNYATGSRLIPYGREVSRPGYTEGGIGQSAMGFGDMLGELGYTGLTAFGGPYRNLLDVLPSEIPLLAPKGNIIGTNVAIGPISRFPQGSRKTGEYAQPRLSPTVGRLSAILKTFGIPAPVFQISEANRIGAQQTSEETKARLQRIINKIQSEG